MNHASEIDIALRTLPVIGLVIAAIAILVSWAIRREYEATAHKYGLISFSFVTLAAILDILFIAYNTPTFEAAICAFLASLAALFASVIILTWHTWT